MEVKDQQREVTGNSNLIDQEKVDIPITTIVIDRQSTTHVFVMEVESF